MGKGDPRDTVARLRYDAKTFHIVEGVITEGERVNGDPTSASLAGLDKEGKTKKKLKILFSNII